MQIPEQIKDDVSLEARQAVTGRLGLKHWHWHAEPALADEPIHGGKVRMLLPFLAGWIKGAADSDKPMTEARDFMAIVRADTLGEAVSVFEVMVIAHLEKYDATERERWIEDLEWSKDREAIRVTWGSQGNAAEGHRPE